MAKPKLTSRQIKEIKKKILAGDKIRDLARHYEVNPSTITYHGKGIVLREARSNGLKGNKNAKKLTESQRIEIRRRRKYQNATELAKEFDVHPSTIARA